MGTDVMAVRALPAVAAAVPAARRFATEAVKEFGGYGDELDVARLLVTELATNSVVHAHSPIRVSVIRTDRQIRVEVRDDDPAPLELRGPPDPEATDGRGLWLVAALASSWGVNHNHRGKTVWFQIDATNAGR